MQIATHLIGLAVIVGVLLLTILIGSLILRPIWNAVMPEVFGLKPLTQKQSCNFLSVIVSLVVFAAIAVLCVNRILDLPL